MQISNPLVGVDHCEPRSLAIAFFDVFLNAKSGDFWQLLEFLHQVVESVVGVHSQLLQRFRMLLEDFLEEHGHHVAEHDRVADFHLQQMLISNIRDA